MRRTLPRIPLYRIYRPGLHPLQEGVRPHQGLFQRTWPPAAAHFPAEPRSFRGRGQLRRNRSHLRRHNGPSRRLRKAPSGRGKRAARSRDGVPSRSAAGPFPRGARAQDPLAHFQCPHRLGARPSLQSGASLHPRRHSLLQERLSGAQGRCRHGGGGDRSLCESARPYAQGAAGGRPRNRGRWRPCKAGRHRHGSVPRCRESGLLCPGLRRRACHGARVDTLHRHLGGGKLPPQGGRRSICRKGGGSHGHRDRCRPGLRRRHSPRTHGAGRQHRGGRPQRIRGCGNRREPERLPGEQPRHFREDQRGRHGQPPRPHETDRLRIRGARRVRVECGRAACRRPGGHDARELRIRDEHQLQGLFLLRQGGKSHHEAPDCGRSGILRRYSAGELQERPEGLQGQFRLCRRQVRRHRPHPEFRP